MSASASTFRTQLRYPSLPNVTIRFLGLFDTVGSFFMPATTTKGASISACRRGAPSTSCISWPPRSGGRIFH